MSARIRIRHAHIQHIYYLVFGTLVFAVAIAYPRHNWDTIAYAAATTQFESFDKRYVHAIAYRDAGEYMPRSVFGFLTDETPEDYRAQVFEDPELFAAQLDFYTGRPAYIGAAWLLRKSGLNAVFALHVLSGLSAFLGLLLLAAIARSHLPAAGIYVLPIATALFGLFRVSRLGTPDTMAFAAVIASVWLLLRNQRATLLLLPLLVTVRSDLILWSTPLYAYLWVTNLFSRRAVALSVLMSGLLLLILQANHPGLSALLHMTLLENTPLDPAQPPQLTLLEYAGLLRQGLLDLRSDSAFGLFLLVVMGAVVSALQKRRQPQKETLLLLLIAASMAYFVAHFLLFPVSWERFFLGPYTIAAFALMAFLGQRSTRRHGVPTSA